MSSPTSVTLGDFRQLADGAVQFAYTNVGGQNSTVYASTNLLDWTALGAATQISSGIFQFTDGAATNFPWRFYKVRTP